MALSQVQCLDDNHVNWPVQESKAQFLYSEDQRLALEALFHGGRKAFQEYIQDHSMRQFLSELEQNDLIGAAVAYQPESEGQVAEDVEDVAGSQQYWPERSDDSIPELDLGWLERVSYRGVTRVSVYTQPPMDGQKHIKEIVRNTITMAQKVIAVVMDLFTDVDIFKDLLEAGFKRKVAVYIVLEGTGVPHFLSMCRRASMHRGHLKNLRVRRAGGTVLCTRSLRKVCGLLSQKFMFVDGDRAVSGSYSYTWTASRLDRNLITVLTGQAVETFDKQFRQLYCQSEGVSLSEIDMEAEPVLKPAPQPLALPMLSPAMARRLINPKYTLVSAGALGNAGSSGAQNATGGSSDKSSARTAGSPKPSAKVPQHPDLTPTHPGLLGLEPVNLMHYLPTWPEPEPSSDVIGFINVRDCSKTAPVHLTRSELCETSQAICFKNPLILPEEPLPEKACPRSQLKNLRTANGPSTTEAPGAQKETTEVSSISAASEEHDETLRTTDSQSSTDALEAQKETKEVSSISATSEEPKKDENLRTANGPSTAHPPGKQKEVSSISAASEKHHTNLTTETTANGLNNIDTQGVRKEAKEVSRIPVTLEEHSENLGTANGLSATDSQEVQKETEEVSSIPVTSEEHHQNLKTANDASAADTNGIQKEAKEVSSIPAMSEEHYENTEPVMPGLACNGSIDSEGQIQADELNTARAYQPIPEQQLQEKPHPQHAARILRTSSEWKQEKRPTHRLVQTQGRKAIQTASRPPASNVQLRSIYQPNPAGGRTGGHALWHGERLAQSRPGRGSDSPSRDQSSARRSSFPSQNPNVPYRQLHGRPQGHLGGARPAQPGTGAHRALGPQGDALLFNRRSQFRPLNRTGPEAPLGSLQRRAQLGRKGAD